MSILSQNKNLSSTVPTPTKKKRYSFIPLDISGSSMALPGELVVDRNTGDFYITDDFGNLKSRTNNIETLVESVIQNNSANIIGDLYSDQRKSYRFFFDSSVVRLDRSLKLPTGSRFFRIHDMTDGSLIYTQKAGVVGEDTPYTGTLVNNREYWVTFYNVSGDALTQNKFVAKRADAVISDEISPEKLLERIEIETAKDVLYLGETWRELYCKVFAYYADGSRRDVTNSTALILEKPNLNSVGEKYINALFYNTRREDDCNRYAEASKTIVVREELVIKIVNIKVYPQILILPDGKKKIELSIIATFENGTEQDITNRTVVTNFDETLFNKPQIIDIYNSVDPTYQHPYTLNVRLNETPATVYFGDNLIWISNELDNVGSVNSLPLTKYMIRDAGDLDKYYTGLVDIGYSSPFGDRIRTGQGIIIEYYDDNEELKLSYYARAEYRPEGTNPNDLIKKR